MKKKLLFILPLATLCVVGVGASAYQVKAEDEPIIVPIVEEEPEEQEVEELSEEEVSKLQEVLDKVNAEYAKLKEAYDKAMQTEILGVTLGTIIGGVIAMLLGFVGRSVDNKNLKNACMLVEKNENLQKASRELHEQAQAKLEEYKEQLDNALKENTELRENLEFAIQTTKDIIETNKALVKELDDLKAIVLKMAYSNKDLVKNGVARDLYENYEKE